MAESIYTLLDNRTVATPVDGKDYNHSLPSKLFPTSEQFESPGQLIAWANENNFTAKLIQKGLQKGIIEVRATFKSCKKTEIWSEELGEKNLAAMEWKTVNRPETAMSDENKALSILGKMSAEEIAEMLKKLGK
jgi:hypothetical protein